MAQETKHVDSELFRGQVKAALDQHFQQLRERARKLRELAALAERLNAHMAPLEPQGVDVYPYNQGGVCITYVQKERHVNIRLAIGEPIRLQHWDDKAPMTTVWCASIGEAAQTVQKILLQ